MRVLIVAAVLACAAAAPSGLLGSPYGLGHGAPLALGHGIGLGAVAPTIPPGDLQGAAIDAHVEASDHVRASHDAARELHDQASEIHGQQINAAEDHSWQAVDASLTHQAQIDGAAAGVAPIVAKQIAGHGAYAAAPLAHGYAAAAPLAHGYAAAPLAHGYAAAPLAQGLGGLGLAGHGLGGLGLAGHGLAGYGSSSVVQQSLSQSHPAPIYHSAPVLAHAAPAYGHGVHGW